jgi:scyllo-inositol 2-dehydrogenase (NADP+)
MINVGLVGFGMAGRVFHAPHIAATTGLSLTAIATRRGAEQAAHAYPAARISSPEELILAKDIDLVVIATPNDSHADLTLRALDAGKSVVVDKPMATSVADAARMIERAESRGLRLGVFQNRRWDDDFLTVRRLLAAGKLGEWIHFESRFDRFRPAVTNRWREHQTAGAGIWWDLGPHLVDQALLLFGRPEAVMADLAIQRAGAQVPDYANVTLWYGQRRAVVRALSLDANPAFRLRVQGTLGVFMTRGVDPQEAVLSGHVQPPSQQRCGELTLVDGANITTFAEPLERGDYGAFYRGVRDSLESGNDLPVTSASALAVMEVMETAIVSARCRSIVSL